MAKEIYHKYWKAVFEDFGNNQDIRMDLTISTLCHRYCVMQRRITNKYRCHRFELLLRELALNEIKHGVSAWMPSRIAAFSTFLIGFANDSIELPEYFLKKVEEMESQFTVSEIINISIGLEFYHRNGIPRK